MEKVMDKFLFATKNSGKLRQFESIAEQYNASTIQLLDVGLGSIEPKETGKTFEENAEIKFNEYTKEYNDCNSSIYFITDDSGIEIPALNNEPGVYTRRWAGHEMDDEEILSYCLDKMKNFEGKQRVAIFKTVIAVGKKGQKPQFFTGEMQGTILSVPRKSAPRLSGFPFRSIFYLDSMNKMIYELSESEELYNHRNLAFTKMFNLILLGHSQNPSI